MTEACPRCASGAFVDGCCALCGYGFVARKRKKPAKKATNPAPETAEHVEPWWVR